MVWALFLDPDLAFVCIEKWLIICVVLSHQWPLLVNKTPKCLRDLWIGAADDSDVELFVEDGTLVDDVDGLDTGSAPLGLLTIFHAFMEEKCCLVVLSTLSGWRPAHG